MKGISHFSTGVAVASCFPCAIEAALTGNPLYFVLGGVAGLMADTMDFKFYRFFYKHTLEVVPDPLDLDPKMIAEAIAKAVGEAANSGKPVRIKLNTIRMGADLWRRYTVEFDIPGKRVNVTLGPIVDTGGKPAPGKADREGKSASVELPCKIELDYEASTNVDIFDGPMFEMNPITNDTVVPQFIPWHRQWSHSFVVGAALGVLGWPTLGLWAGVVICAAYAAHVLVDQIGFMGSSLFWPITRHRTPGLKLTHSGESLPNLLTVWFSCLLIYWNLARHAPPSVPPTSPFRLLFWGAVVPLGAIVLARKILKKPTLACFARN